MYSCFVVSPVLQSVWYELEGDGGCITASLRQSNSDVIIAAYEGAGCGNLTCVGETQQFVSNQVTFPTENGATYYLLVGGVGGDYVLEVEVGGRVES